MPPAIKHDLNRSGWESTDMPSVCERCLPDNPYVQMLKEDYGECSARLTKGDQCKICTRPFTLFKWKADRTARQKRTVMCLTCARLKNCCQCCMLDLTFGLPIMIRDAALKMIAPGPDSAINREFFAQNNEKEIEEGRGGLEAYDKTDEKARELLRRLAKSDPYRRDKDPSLQTAAAPDASVGPVRTTDAKRGRGRGKPFPSTAQLGPREQDWAAPRDPNIKSLFIVGVEDDLPEYAIRDFFAKYGKLQSVVCSHRAHCAYINFIEREDAEKAAEACKGRAIISGCPLRVTWGRPKQLDTMDQSQRMEHARAGREAVGNMPRQARAGVTKALGESVPEESSSSITAMAPPGSEEVNYRSLAGD